MSDASAPPSTPHPQPQHGDIPAGAHEGPIRTPKQLILAVFFSFVIPIAVIVMLVEFVSSGAKPSAGTDVLAPEAIARRLEPVGMVVVKDASDPASLKTGEQVFAAQCTTCHSAGVLGAPKLGDKDAWAPRIQTGFAALLDSALHGKGNMGPQGGGDFTDFEVARAVVYMANRGGASFEEPKAPVAGATTASAASAPIGVASSAEGTTATNPAAVVAQAGASAAAMPVAQSPAAASAAVVAMGASSAGTTVAAAEPATRTAAATTVAPPLYGQVCQVCHATGLAGAPKFGDKAAWTQRLAEAKDIDGLTAIAIKGKGAMPPRGGSSASDADIKAVVTYMVNSAK